MDLDFDAGTVFYAVGVLLAFAALLYFARDLVFDLSITVKAALLGLGTGAFFVAGLAVDRDVLDAVAFVLAAVTGIVFLGYVIVRFSLGETATFLVLALAATVFVGLGYALRERGLALSPAVARRIVLGIVVLGLLLVAADTAVGGVTYDVETNETVTVDADDLEPDGHGDVRPAHVTVGRLVATNGPVFRRSLNPPPLAGCVAGTELDTDRDLLVDHEPAEWELPATIGGDGRVTVTVKATVPLHENATEPRTFAVRRGSCPATADEPTLIVGERDSRSLD